MTRPPTTPPTTPPTPVRSRTEQTDRLRTHWLETGPDDGPPVVLIHGNLSTCRFWDPVLDAAPAGYRFLAVDMRGFGDSEPAALDGSRGLRDWADDTAALLRHLGIDEAPHLVGWSTGGAAVAQYAQDRPVASLTLVDPVSPHGFGGVRPDGRPCTPSFAGSGAGLHNPDFTERLRTGDRGTDSPFSPRNVITSAYWSPDHQVATERLDLLVDEVLKSRVDDDGYPGDAEASDDWPGVAPGTRGILNGLSPKYCDWTGLVDVDPKPPVLWTHGTADVVVADGSPWEAGQLGALGLLPGWPGPEAFPPQLMVTQIRALLDRYAAAGGRVRTEMFEGSGHFPVEDATERWLAVFLDHLEEAQAARPR